MSLLIFFETGYTDLDWHLRGNHAMMVLANPDHKPLILNGPLDLHPVDVTYVGSGGELLVPGKLLSAEMAKHLINGEQVPVIYRKSNPTVTLYRLDDLESPWGYLLGGVLAIVVAVFVHKKIRQVAAA